MSLTKPVKPRRIRVAKPYRLIKRKRTRYIAFLPRGGRQETTKQETMEEAKRFAFQRIAACHPHLAAELGIEITPNLKGLR